MRRRLLLHVLGCALCVSGAFPHARAQGNAGLAILGDVTTPLSVKADDLTAMPRKTVEVKDQSGATVTYEGVLVGELLKRAGVPVGGDLHGAALSTCVKASATDGYQVVFSLGELDPALSGSDIIVADTANGKPLSDTQGRLRIVVPRDARPARSVRMLERLEVVRLKK
jgi:hypothetical protein